MDCDWCSLFFPACAPLSHRRDTSLLLATANTAGDSGVAWVFFRIWRKRGVGEVARKKGRREEWLMATRIGWNPGRVVVGILVGKANAGGKCT